MDTRQAAITQPIRAERRRSPRVPWRIPFALTWKPNARVTVREHGETEAVNAHGALVRLSTNLRPGQPVTILAKGKSIVVPARVVVSQGMAEDGFARLGVELHRAGLEFWTELAR